ncbi:MAG: hypothetical protein OEY89_00120 [Gammaproteobacteria bacterium]|nr:hypothetical protein [Gammaproteobacteria bacterium]
MNLWSKYKKVINSPLYYFQIFIAIVKGSFYILYCRIFKRNIKIGFPFIVYGNVNIKGPGKVIIGKKCTVVENVFRGLSITTFSNDSIVSIGGEGCLLGGLTIRCHSKIELGNNIMTAVSLIQDTLFVTNNNKSYTNYDSSLWKSEPIVIGNNVWLGGHCCILPGSKIGDDCVLSACSVIYKNEINNYNLASGNPVRRSLPIERILGLRK